MFGLEFAPHEAVNALAGGLIGAIVSLWGAWVLAKRQLRNTRTLARFLEAVLDSDRVEIQYDEDGELVGLGFTEEVSETVAVTEEVVPVLKSEDEEDDDGTEEGEDR